jgi:hypothetical protein
MGLLTPRGGAGPGQGGSKYPELDEMEGMKRTLADNEAEFN